MVYAFCPDMNCNMIVSERVFKQVLEPSDFAKYEEFVLKSFIDLSSTAKWCPGTDCGKVVENKFSDAIEISCTCGY